ncbi:MAG: ABC transporter permease [Patescibacteria group bacterium]|jgi:lipopolysaccharide transport system permease protein
MEYLEPITIRPKKGWVGINIKELWRYRELFYIFVWRDIKIRYKQTAIGIMWAILQPFLLMVVFSIFFGSFAKMPSNGTPYPIFVFSGLLFWNYFSISLTNASDSLVSNENIIKKIYFPRLILPLSPTMTPLVDFFIAFIVLVGMIIYYHSVPTLTGILLLPLLLFTTFLSASGLGMFLSAINVRYRDIRYALPFFIQSLLFVTPVIYPTSIVSPQFQWILKLNPMTGIIEAARAGIIGNASVDFRLLGISFSVAIIMFVLGIFYFRKTERIFADVA